MFQNFSVNELLRTAPLRRTVVVVRNFTIFVNNGRWRWESVHQQLTNAASPLKCHSCSWPPQSREAQLDAPPEGISRTGAHPPDPLAKRLRLSTRSVGKRSLRVPDNLCGSLASPPTRGNCRDDANLRVRSICSVVERRSRVYPCTVETGAGGILRRNHTDIVDSHFLSWSNAMILSHGEVTR